MLPHNVRRNLGPILQRLPMLTHLSMIPFALLGPTYLPYLFGAILLYVHCMLWTVNLRTIWGAFLAWRGVKQHSETDWRAEYAAGRRSLPVSSDALMFDEVEHLIFCPNYAEDITVLRETLYLLSTHPLALSYHPVLAMEAREAGAAQKAQQLMAEFRSSFRDIGYTLHPGGLDGEAAGKSSNLAWAIRQAFNELKEEGDEERIAKIVVTVIDSDTALAGDYFAAISCKYALRPASERSRMSFVPPICFDRNAHDVPVAVRVTDIMWALAGLSSIYPGSGAKIPTSAYSLSMTLASRVGFHDAGPQAIGEDMHMFIKCLFSTGGNLISETIYSPASQLDVVAGERGGLKGFWNDHVARYKQAIRHMWGSLDTGYGLTRLINRDFTADPQTETFASPVYRQAFPTVFTAESEAVIGLKTIPEELGAAKHRRNFADEDFATPSPSDSSVSSSAASVVSADDEGTSDSSLSEVEESYNEKVGLVRPVEEQLSRKIVPFISLCMRLYEAHLLMGHMLLLVTMRVFTTSTSEALAPPTFEIPILTLEKLTSGAEFVSWAYAFTDRMRAASLVFSIIMFMFYDRYHQQAAKYRWQVPGGRLGVQSSDRSYRSFPFAMFDYFAMPAGIVYGIIPILHAQFMHLFTDRLVYTVSFKPKGKDNRPRDVEKAIPV
jgi:hypothetical protein